VVVTLVVSEEAGQMAGWGGARGVRGTFHNNTTWYIHNFLKQQHHTKQNMCRNQFNQHIIIITLSNFLQPLLLWPAR
jgi:hypothetical protein